MTLDPDELRSREFRTALRGYDRRAVDELLAHIAADVEAGRPVSGDDIRNARFELHLRGYNPDDVDRVLADLVQELDN